MLYEGDFLQQWPPLRRSLIANQFCAAVREGAQTAEAVIEAVKADALRRLLKPWNDEERKEVQRVLLKALETFEAVRFAGFILWRESLPDEIRREQKDRNSEVFQELWMKKNPPTEKQLDYLEGLGCKTKPTNRWEASQLIEEYLKKRERKYGNLQRQD